jgi:hypothetical protein
MIFDVEGSALSDAFNIDGESLNHAYNIDGDSVFPDVIDVDYDTYSSETWLAVSLQNMQGFDIFDDYIFQFRANLSGMENKMCTINKETASIIQNDIQAMSGHGGSASFSDEYYDENDQFPLLYVSAQTAPCTVYVNRVTTSSSELIRTLRFPLESSGYFADHVYDEPNATMYVVGYTENNYSSDLSGTNKVRVSVWNMNNMTENNDGTYTPEFIRSFEIPFIYVMQGKVYHDEMIWICSGYYTSSSHSYIYAISPVDGTLLHTIDLETVKEVEGLSFISQNEMIVGLAGATYKKYTFAIN